MQAALGDVHGRRVTAIVTKITKITVCRNNVAMCHLQ